ncbi:MAG: 4-hydroxy-tetrahydrodipicolinate synthase [Planctomycetota bacterium]|jgi:4-hydroxy-tetrahydrodipicolinate synthase
MTPIQGSYIALPTPFRRGRLDLEQLGLMIERVAELGADGILIAGTTGEVPTLNEYEQRSLLHAAVEINRGRLSLMAGVGTNCTRTSVELSRFAMSCGVDSILVVTPYYNCPTRRGLLLHYGEIASATELPLVLYNVPSRTGVDLTPDIAKEIARSHPSVVAIKETSTSIDRVKELTCTSDLAVLCGEDRMIYDYCKAGAVGAISVVGNLAPRHVTGIINSTCSGIDLSMGRELQAELAPLLDALDVDVNPVPIKAALAELDICDAEVRAPLATLDNKSLAKLRAALATSKAIYETQAEPLELN